MPFSKIFPSSRSLNLLKKGLESPGKVLEFHLHQQRVDTLLIIIFCYCSYVFCTIVNVFLYIYVVSGRFPLKLAFADGTIVSI